MPGRPITDQQQRYYMSLRQKHPQKAAAAMAGFSTSTGYRVEKVPRSPSERRRERRHGGGKPDPLAELWDKEIAPLLESTPGLMRIPGLSRAPFRIDGAQESETIARSVPKIIRAAFRDDRAQFGMT